MKTHARAIVQAVVAAISASDLMPPGLPIRNPPAIDGLLALPQLSVILYASSCVMGRVTVSVP